VDGLREIVSSGSGITILITTDLAQLRVTRALEEQKIQQRSLTINILAQVFFVSQAELKYEVN